MAKFRKKPVVIEATQWFRLGDHQRVTAISSNELCGVCQTPLAIHGWVQTLEGGHIVCPGDWIITGVANEVYPCKPAIFAVTYDPVLPGEALA